MTKRIIAIIFVAVLLCSVLAFSASAASSSTKDYYEWSYLYHSGMGSASWDGSVSVLNTDKVFPLTYYDVFDSSQGDRAIRHYYMDYVYEDKYTADTAMPLLDDNEFKASLTVNDFISSTVPVGSPYYREDWECFMFGTKSSLSMDGTGDIALYDPCLGEDYNMYYVYCYFQSLPVRDDGLSHVTLSMTNPIPDNDIMCYYFTLDSVGTYNVEMIVSFYDETTGKYSDFVCGEFEVFVQEDNISENIVYNQGYKDGFDDGVIKGIEMSSQTDYTLKGLINAIILAPFNFVKTAFNFEIFGVNMSSTITFIFTYVIIVTVLIFVIKRLS